MLGFAFGSAALYSSARPRLFPERGRRPIAIACPRAGWHARRRHGEIFGQVENAIREVVPADERAMILDNIGLTQSFTIMAYIDNGTVSNADGEILVSLKPDHQPTADYVAQLRSELPRRVPAMHVLL